MSAATRRILLIVLLVLLTLWFVGARWCQSRQPSVYDGNWDGPDFDFPFPELPPTGSGDGTITLDGSSTRPRPIDDDYRPEWWVAEPIVSGERVSVALFSDGLDLSAIEKDLRIRLRKELCMRKATVLEEGRFRFEFGLLANGQFRLFALAVARVGGDPP